MSTDGVRTLVVAFFAILLALCACSDDDIDAAATTTTAAASTPTTITTETLQTSSTAPTTSTTAPTLPPGEEDRIAVAAELLDRWTQGWNDSDPDAVLSVFTDDALYIEFDPDEEDNLVPMEHMRSYVMDRGGLVKNARRTSELASSGNGTYVCVVEFNLSGTHVGAAIEIELEGDLAKRIAWLGEGFEEVERVVSDTVPSGSVAGIDLYNASAEQLALVEWAIARFDTAGLDRPPVSHVTFPPTMPCVPGVSGMTFCGTDTCSIDICTGPEAFTETTAFPLDARRTILHELGHAWNATFVDEATRQAFLALRNLNQWNGDVWQDSGNEQAAEILMWGLIRTPSPTASPPRHAPNSTKPSSYSPAPPPPCDKPTAPTPDSQHRYPRNLSDCHPHPCRLGPLGG